MAARRPGIRQSRRLVGARALARGAKARGLASAAALLLLAALAGCGRGADESLRLYVTRFTLPYGTGAVIGYDAPSLRLRGELPANEVATRLALAPDGRTLWISGEASRDLLLVDTAADTLLRRIPLGLPAAGGAFDRSGGRFLVAHGAVVAGREARPLATLVDAAAARAITRIEVGEDPRSVCLDPGGRLAYVANTGDGTISVVDLALETVVETVPSGAGVHHLAADPRGRWLYAACLGAAPGDATPRGEGELVVHALPGLEVASRLAPGGHPSHVTTTPDGALLVLSELNEDPARAARLRLYRVEDGPRLDLWRDLEFGGNTPLGDISPGGRWFAAADLAEGRLLLADLDAGEVARRRNLAGAGPSRYFFDVAFARPAP
ncbi:MAG: YncE family protein [Candidatus Krumholzibacteriota bacterium]|nr:YncE family protein [Candidatus Krumholzibacteriota bacterium]